MQLWSRSEDRLNIPRDEPLFSCQVTKDYPCHSEAHTPCRPKDVSLKQLDQLLLAPLAFEGDPPLRFFGSLLSSSVMDFNAGNTGQTLNLNSTFTAYKIPLSAIITWPASNLEDPERRFWVVPYAFCLQVLTSAALSGRIWARLTRQAGSFGADDALILAAWVGSSSAFHQFCESYLRRR